MPDHRRHRQERRLGTPERAPFRALRVEADRLVRRDPAEARGGWRPVPPDVRRLVRTAGTVLALTSLVLAFAAGAQGRVYADPTAGHITGLLPWLFGAFAAVAILGIFVFVIWLVRGPDTRPPGARPPGHA